LFRGESQLAGAGRLPYPSVDRSDPALTRPGRNVQAPNGTGT